MHLGDEINALPSNLARAQFCLRMAEKCRDEYFAGRDAEVDKMLNPATRTQKIRWGHYSRAALIEIGRQRWRSSAIAKQLASDEQMFSRWAGHYYVEDGRGEQIANESARGSLGEL